MFGKVAVKLARWVLRRTNLSIEDRNLLTTCILDTLGALPIRDMIIMNPNGQILVNEKQLTVEGARALRDGAITALKNPTLKLIHDQVAFAAIASGVHKQETERQSFFMRAALWYGQQEIELLNLLAGEDRELDP